MDSQNVDGRWGRADLAFHGRALANFPIYPLEKAWHSSRGWQGRLRLIGSRGGQRSESNRACRRRFEPVAQSISIDVKNAFVRIRTRLKLG